jgi:hypothetical protein
MRLSEERQICYTTSFPFYFFLFFSKVWLESFGPALFLLLGLLLGLLLQGLDVVLVLAVGLDGLLAVGGQLGLPLLAVVLGLVESLVCAFGVV